MQNREKIITDIAQRRTCDIDLDTLLDFFYQKQVEFLDDMTDDELLQHIEEYEL